MQAIIFNSGCGKRMGEFTAHHHKAMAPLANGETIFERQLRLLKEQGILDVVVTTGAFAEQLQEKAQLPAIDGMNLTFVHNDAYATTNYIYSMHLARQALNPTTPLLLLHGDLVWNGRLLERLLIAPVSDWVMVNAALPCPDKDFKARLREGLVQAVSVSIAGEDCAPLQPMYRLTPATWNAWFDAVDRFVAEGRRDVYAEEALNTLLPDLSLRMFSYQDNLIDEVDTLDDLARVSAQLRQFDFAEQRLLVGANAHRNIEELLAHYGSRRPMAVAGKSFATSPVRAYLQTTDYEVTHFSGFSPNPTYEEVVAGVKLFREKQCDTILSVGGGSAMDVAKAIKLFAPMTVSEGETYLQQTPQYWQMPHIAVATTAGTGSESTRYSVIYHQGVKQSMVHDSIFPECAVLDAVLLQTLPDYQKKCTLLDAICQCIEAIWSVHATPVSTAHAVEGIKLVLAHTDAYLAGDLAAAEAMLLAANRSGQAINITQTTAAHAMSYQLGAVCDIPHGYAVALCLSPLWKHLAGHLAEGKSPDTLRGTLDTIATSFGCGDIARAIERFDDFQHALELAPPRRVTSEELDLLVKSVNPTRLANHPIDLTKDTILQLYQQIVCHEE